MKRVLLIVAFLAIAIGGYAKKNKAPNPVCGSWKYSNASSINDFQRISNQSPYKEASTEYLVFFENNEFRHDFINAKKQVYKCLKGKWKIVDDKIIITYADIDFQLMLSYFFIDKDLVLGQNFNHVIFTKDANGMENINLASK